MNRFRTHSRTCSVAAAVAVVALAAPAGATVVEKLHADDEPYDDSYTCDATFEVAGLFSGQLILKQGTGPKTETFPFLDNFSYRETHTNTETGNSFTVSGNAIFSEVMARQVEGTVFEFQAVEAGQPMVVRNAEGDVVLRDRGAVVYTFLFDTLGDGQPGGDYLNEWDASVRGPRPSWDVDWCVLAEELTQ